MTTNPSPDAVEALADALPTTHENTNWKELADDLLVMLEAKGFTITRQPAMTDAELELLVDDIFIECETKAEMKLAIIALAKRCRG